MYPEHPLQKIFLIFYGATDTPVTSGNVSSGFQSHSGKPYLPLGVHDVHSLRFISGVTPANLLMASMLASQFSLHVCFSRGRMQDLIGRPPAYQSNVLTSRPPVTGLCKRLIRKQLVPKLTIKWYCGI